MKETRQEKTTIIVAHRISSVISANEIVVFDKGRIVERGQHDELVAQQGWYAHMYEQQQVAITFEENLSGKGDGDVGTE
ncbi:hypothetical protein GCM10025879_12890 [Leuconostoc litchii]|nr:hypothetical protein GCM10025879_12890 [Leuconostoc litchii]